MTAPARSFILKCRVVGTGIRIFRRRTVLCGRSVVLRIENDGIENSNQTLGPNQTSFSFQSSGFGNMISDLSLKYG